MEMIKKAFFLVALAALTPVSKAADFTINSTKVNMLSFTINAGALLVQTEPRPNLSTLSCTNDYWLTLHKAHPNFDEINTMLLAAQMADKPIRITIDDSNGTDFCRLNRVITLRDS